VGFAGICAYFGSFVVLSFILAYFWVFCVFAGSCVLGVLVDLVVFGVFWVAFAVLGIIVFGFDIIRTFWVLFCDLL